MSFIKFIKSKAFTVQLGIISGITLVLLIGLVQYMKFYTKHGQEIEVPNLTDLHIDQLQEILEVNDLKFMVIDSTYLQGKRPMLVYGQDPKPGSKVKEGRTIYISITASNTPKVKLPNLIDLCLRKATIDLKNLGLGVGALVLRPDIANNVVLEMTMGGSKVYPGKQVARGSIIDLVVGIYNADSLVNVPNLVGLTVEEATLYLSETALYLGAVNYGAAITDSSKALVVRQFPEVNDEEPINTMSYVDIWVE
jgi:beta-lactam-binding protein with PASTA domain